MQLQSLLEKFKVDLQSHEKCLQSSFWCLPVHTIQVSYKPVLKRKMDILMKMILISVQKAPFLNGLQISEILLVEELFIQDLLSKCVNMGLILRNENGFEITEKGKVQLETGIYEEDQETSTLELLYSSSHMRFFTGDLEEVLEYEDFPETIYRYYESQEQPTIPNDLVLKEIQSSNEESEEEETSDTIQITSIDEIQFEQINDIPCIELIIYNKSTDKFYSKVWNTLINNWDHVIEQQITENEGSTWKEKLLD
ncbi:hypothetical protein [Ureibacillus acetophenoni]|uniref:Uncharacterized protein n=1 Tax=Ureibacillus acetophenoni TaxID=614649 RepID=A0A285U632_9BACL|nr:hypothetical protein [Ureibacillus acetophenoni]SOC37292.1 hypothetical protein SAMN05877842_103127 [Ureibacillus acetophenoni]